MVEKPLQLCSDPWIVNRRQLHSILQPIPGIVLVALFRYRSLDRGHYRGFFLLLFFQGQCSLRCFKFIIDGSRPGYRFGIG